MGQHRHCLLCGNQRTSYYPNRCRFFSSYGRGVEGRIKTTSEGHACDGYCQLHPWFSNDGCVHCRSRRYQPGCFFTNRVTIRPSHLERHAVSKCNNGYGCLHYLFLHILRRQSEYDFLPPTVRLRPGRWFTLLSLGVIRKLSPIKLVRDTNSLQVSPTLNIPINAVLISWVIACGLACIPLGSTAAFLNIQTIGNSGLLVSYIICISCRLHHRNTVGPYGTLPEPPPFFLGKWGGNIINTLAILFLTCFVVSDMFPPAPNPTVETMNWSSLALGGTICLALLCYTRLRKSYLGAGIGNGRVEMVNLDAVSESKSFDKQV